MSARAVAAAVAAATTGLFLTPVVGEPLRRLANVEADGPDPIYDAPLDPRSARGAAKLLPDRTTYWIDARDADPLLQGNLKALGQLFFTPALPVAAKERAEWVVQSADGVVTVARRR